MLCTMASTLDGRQSLFPYRERSLIVRSLGVYSGWLPERGNSRSAPKTAAPSGTTDPLLCQKRGNEAEAGGQAGDQCPVRGQKEGVNQRDPRDQTDHRTRHVTRAAPPQKKQGTQDPSNKHGGNDDHRQRRPIDLGHGIGERRRQEDQGPKLADTILRFL